MTDDFDALFEEVAAQRAETVSASTAPKPAPPADDDFDALFEQAAAQRSEPAPPAPAPAATAASDPDDFDALFEQAAKQPAPTIAPAIATAPASSVASAAAADDGSPTDKPMFERLGGIVRMLHDSMRELGYDRALSDAASKITDAQGRLEHIATLTEQAANKVLNTIDEGMPAQDVLSKKAKDMESRWGLLFDGKLSIEEFKTLAGDSRQFATVVGEATETEKARLLEIMMAQDFQDITGQLIKKIVTITQLVEGELAQLLRDNAPPELRKEKEKTTELMQGPSVSAMAQDDVDSLLDDLGF